MMIDDSLDQPSPTQRLLTQLEAECDAGELTTPARLRLTACVVDLLTNLKQTFDQGEAILAQAERRRFDATYVATTSTN